MTKTLADAHIFEKIYLIGIGEPGLPDHEIMDAQREILRIPRSPVYRRSMVFGRMLATLQWSWRVWSHVRGMNVTCVNAHSLPVLPLCVALKIRHGAKLVYDTHELETETIATRGLRKKLSKLTERLLIGFADHIFCVGDKIADWYQAHYRILRPTVVRNMPDIPTDLIKVAPVRTLFSIPDDAIVFGYVGLLAKERNIDQLVHIFADAAPGMHLVVIGSGPEEDTIKDAARRFDNIHHLPAVPPREVLPYLTGMDAGISMDLKDCLSYLYSLPNKFFEYIVADLPVLVGGMPEQLEIVGKYDIGWVMPLDTKAATELINTFTPAGIAAKKANLKVARAHLNWSIEEKTLLRAYRTLMAIASIE